MLYEKKTVSRKTKKKKRFFYINLEVFFMPYLTFWRLQVVPGHDVDQEVELVKLCYCHGDVIPLQMERSCVEVRV